jgi:YVTN family beta-propeller protein
MAINAATRAILGLVSVGSGPIALVWNGRDSKLYCANQTSADLTIIDTHADSVLAVIPLADGPAALAWNARDDKVYCVCASAGLVAILDGQTNTVLTAVPVGPNPGSLYWNPLSNLVYAPSRDSARVTLIDGSGDTARVALATGGGPLAIAANALQNRVYIANYLGSSVSVVRDVLGIQEEPVRKRPSKSIAISTIARAGIRLVLRRPSVLLDVSGRRVRDLDAGESSTAGLAPGVYFIDAKGESLRQRLVLVE